MYASVLQVTLSIFPLVCVCVCVREWVCVCMARPQQIEWRARNRWLCAVSMSEELPVGCSLSTSTGPGHPAKNKERERACKYFPSLFSPPHLLYLPHRLALSAQALCHTFKYLSHHSWRPATTQAQTLPFPLLFSNLSFSFSMWIISKQASTCTWWKTERTVSIEKLK